MRKAPRRRPSLETLEDRRLPVTTGLPWPDPQHLTISFMPDGTNLGGAPSTLNQTLDAEMPTATWELDILRAFQSWAVLGGINLSLAADDGSAPGQPGPLQGDSGVGDIRIGARPLSSDKLAMSTPFDLLNNWSGVVILNSDADFGNGSGGTENLYTAVLHEAGVVLGLAETPNDPSSAMYTEDVGPRTGPSAGDAAALQALYGAPAPASNANASLATAAPLTFASSSASASALSKLADNAVVSSLSDVDVYSFTPPASGAVAVDVRASGISLLTARVAVLDASGHLVASADAADPLHNDLTATIPNAVPGARYYVEVQSARPDVFGIGAYRIAVGRPALAEQAVSGPVAPGGIALEGAGNLTFNQAVALTPETPGTDARWPYLVQDSLSRPGQTEYFGIQNGPAPTGAMLVTVWADRPGGLIPRVTVLNADHDVLPAQIVAVDSASETLEVLAPTPGARVVVAVSASGPASAESGAYTLAVTYRATALTIPTLAAGTLTAAHPQTDFSLDVTTSDLYQFTLSGNTGGVPADTAVSATIFDASGRPVAYLDVHGGAAPAGDDVLLMPGKYTVRILAATRTGARLPAFHYVLQGAVRTAPIGPAPADPTLDPVSDSSDPSLVSATLGVVLTLGDSLSSDFLVLTDPFSDLWLD